ncbi:hypothetical protein Q7O60_28065 [Pseudomonas protegens]|uniref:hypothetical protein n=1 Tax=Pseudomonas protegens TaxID=380021 RepID=UPI00274E85D2|nr:hypothetical protein [Pseudomonas protegens]MDP9506863.1 hypothetical protein [Pseudomonas protegens]
MSIDLYTSSTDKVANLDLNKPTLDSGNIILSIGPLNLQAGDILDVTFAHEVTSELPFTVGIGQGLRSAFPQRCSSSSSARLAKLRYRNSAGAFMSSVSGRTGFACTRSKMGGVSPLIR